MYLPHPAIAPWVMGFIDEYAAFPKTTNDDQVDGGTQALLRMAANSNVGAPASSGAKPPEQQRIRVI